MAVVRIIGMGNAEINQLDIVIAPVPVFEHDIVGFYILVHQLLLSPRKIQRLGDVADHRRRPGEFDGLFALQNLFEGLAANELHREVVDPFVLAHGVGLHDVGMVQFGGGASFPEEAFDVFLVIDVLLLQHFQCHRTIQRDLFGEEHLAHSALAQRLFDQKIADHHPRSGNRLGIMLDRTAIGTFHVGTIRRLGGAERLLAL